MTAIVHLKSKVSADEAEKMFLGKMLDENSYDVLVTGDADVYKPNGERLLSLVKGAIPLDVLDAAREPLRHARAYKTNNRGTYAGGVRSPIKTKDGTWSKTIYVVDKHTGEKMTADSSIIGFFERTARLPFCRATAYVAKETERWPLLVDLARRVADVFEARAPKRFEAQRAYASKVHPAYIIEGTPFTTLTVNQTIRAAVHRDAGDYKPGFGCICVATRGTYRGHHLVFPEFRAAVDVRDGDVLLFDPHELHGNTEMRDASADAERVSVVLYLRSGISECGTPEEELERATHARGGALEESDG